MNKTSSKQVYIISYACTYINEAELKIYIMIKVTKVKYFITEY